MNELALFAGAGGGILGGHLLGWRTVCAVERDAYAASILAQRQNDGHLPPFPIWSDVCSFDGRPWRGLVDVISGGFPCQDISAAGKGVGIGGKRSGLWSEMARIIGEVRPRFVFVENSPLLVSRGLGLVLADLAGLGYDASWGIVGADDAGAPHRRKRIWIRGELADARRERLEGFAGHGDDGNKPGRNGAQPHGPTGPRRVSWWDQDPADVPHSKSHGHRPGGESRNVCEAEWGPDGSLFGQSGFADMPSNVADSDCVRELQPERHEPKQRRRVSDCGEAIRIITEIDGSPVEPSDIPGRFIVGGSWSVDVSPYGLCKIAEDLLYYAELEESWFRENHVADTTGGEDLGRERGIMESQECGRAGFDASPDIGGEDVGDSAGSGLPKRGGAPFREPGADEEPERSGGTNGSQRPIISRLGGMVDGLACGMDLAGAFVRGPIPRVANGTPHRVDRLRAIGNGQVPAVVRLAWEALT